VAGLIACRSCSGWRTPLWPASAPPWPGAQRSITLASIQAGGAFRCGVPQAGRGGLESNSGVLRRLALAQAGPGRWRRWRRPRRRRPSCNPGWRSCRGIARMRAVKSPYDQNGGAGVPGNARKLAKQDAVPRWIVALPVAVDAQLDPHGGRAGLLCFARCRGPHAFDPRIAPPSIGKQNRAKPLLQPRRQANPCLGGAPTIWPCLSLRRS